MSYIFKPAQMDGVGMFIALIGGSRTGKTYSAMTLARGIAGPNGRIAAIDTEGKRMSHYKDKFLTADGNPFDVINMQSPFTAERFADAAKEAEKQGFDVLVIDNFSLEWSGAGGVLQLYDEYFEKHSMNQKMSDTCWRLAKKAHKRMMDDMLQRTIPIIFCIRANEVAAHLGGGWKIDQDQRFIYDWTACLPLHPDTPGVPRYDMVNNKKKPLWKVQEQHRHLFPEGKMITADAGAALQAWRSTDAARTSTSVNRVPDPPTPEEVRTALVERFEAAETAADFEAIKQDEYAAQQFRWLVKHHPQLGAEANTARLEAEARTAKPVFQAADENEWEPA